MKRWAPAALAALIALPGASYAQSRASAQAAPDANRGWLGIRINERYDCMWEETQEWNRCSLVINVQSVQEDGPAATGGVQSGDLLVAIDGEDITAQNWGRIFASIRRQQPISVDVMRGEDRHFVRVIPGARPADTEVLAWSRPPVRVRAPRAQPGVFVITLTEPQDAQGTRVALTLRDTEDRGVAIEPSVIRVIDGQLGIRALDPTAFPDLPELRLELLGDLEAATESAYADATSAIRAMDGVRARLSQAEFRTRLSRLAQDALEDVELAVRFRRSFGGAEYQPHRRFPGPSGLLVTDVVRGTLAARIGLAEGDLIVRAGNRPIREVEDLIDAIIMGEGAVPITWVREGREMTRDWPRR